MASSVMSMKPAMVSSRSISSGSNTILSIPPPSSTTTPTNIITTTSSTTTSSQREAEDERAASLAALAAAEDRLRSLCATNAPSFVAAERRRVATQTSATELSQCIETALPRVQEAISSLSVPSESATATATDKNNDNIKSEKNDEKDEEDEDNKSSDSAASALAVLAERHRLRRRTLLQHSSLLELLELPSLMDACVRSGLYDEALSVAGFANTLERRHPSTSNNNNSNTTNTAVTTTDGGAVAVVAGVISEVRRREWDLRRHLLHRLRSDVTMPQCLEVVTALRRLNGIELERRGITDTTTTPNANNNSLDFERLHGSMELRLQIDFFEARDHWLDTVATLLSSSSSSSSSPPPPPPSSSSKGRSKSTTTAAVVKDTPEEAFRSERLLDGIERYRTRCFEIATQFLTIFRATHSDIITSPSSNNNNNNLRLLSMWTSRRISTFLIRLSHELDSISNASALRDALDATTFFATSMGRLGADFQPLLPPIFEPRLIRIVTTHWIDAVSALRDALRICREAGVASPLLSDDGPTMDNNNDNDDGASTTDDTHPNSSSWDQYLIPTPPPRRLLSFPPLARLVNSYLLGYNELRRCLLPTTFITLRHYLQSTLSDASISLRSNDRLVSAPGFLRGTTTTTTTTTMKKKQEKKMSSTGEAIQAARLLREASSKLIQEFDDIVVPYVTKMLEIALGSYDYIVLESLEREEKKKKKAEEEQERKRKEAEEEERKRKEEEEEEEEEEAARLKEEEEKKKKEELLKKEKEEMAMNLESEEKEAVAVVVDATQNDDDKTMSSSPTMEEQTKEEEEPLKMKDEDLEQSLYG